MGCVEHPGTGDVGIKSLNVSRRPVHEAGARVDDCLEASVNYRGTYKGRGGTDLPEPRRSREAVVLDVTGILSSVGASKEELGTGTRKEEAKYA